MQEGSHGEIAGRLFSHARDAIVPEAVKGATRYSGLLAAIRMLGTQAPRFGAALVADGNCAYQIIEHLSALRNEHSNKGVRDAAEGALSPILQQARRATVVNRPAQRRIALKQCSSGDETLRALSLYGSGSDP